MRSGSECGVYNIGTGQGHSVRELIDIDRDVVGGEITVAEASRRLGDPAVLVADSSLAQSELHGSHNTL